MLKKAAGATAIQRDFEGNEHPYLYRRQSVWVEGTFASGLEGEMVGAVRFELTTSTSRT
jgi:hypothetical protein